jgi:L-ectoine synthase
MIVRNLAEIRETPRKVITSNWESTRLLLSSDNMGFSFHITTIYAGTTNEMWYKNHLEAVFCITGTGKMLNLETDREYEIKPGVIYALDKNDKHVLSALENLTLACVFNPPLNGKEVHDVDGSYRLGGRRTA